MSSLNNIFETMEEAISKPADVVKQFKEKTGKEAIGCFPVYCPEEIIHAAGMFPIGIWGGQTELELSKQYFPAFACSIMQSCLEFGLQGKYDDLSAVIIPGMCDTLICIGQNWKTAVPQVEYVSLVHPQNRKIEAGINYLKNEYSNIRNILEEIGGCKISNENINDSIEIYNEHRKTMREFIKTAAKYPNIITPYKRNTVFKSSFFMLKEEHTKLVKKLIAALNNLQVKEFTGKKILLSGILVDSKEILDIFSENNLAVVADDLAQETRQYRYDVPEGNEGLDRLARYWSVFEGCSLAYDPDKIRGDIIMNDIDDNEIDGIVFCMMKFCDPEEYDYPILKKQIDATNIPSLYIEIDQQMASIEQIRTRIQTFAEILDLRNQ